VKTPQEFFFTVVARCNTPVDGDAKALANDGLKAMTTLHIDAHSGHESEEPLEKVAERVAELAYRIYQASGH
jgi:hypothetical protein